MAQHEKFEVIKFTEHGSRCYSGTEYIGGSILTQWLKFHPAVSKQEILSIIQNIIKQLDLYHRSKKGNFYQYVNPYAVIISGDRKVYLLDFKAGSNTERKKKMQRREIGEHFYPDRRAAKGSLKGDLYSLGKTIQYIFSHCEPQPALSGSEERRILKVTQRCLGENIKKEYRSTAQILKDLPNIKKRRKTALPAATVVFVLLISLSALYWNMEAGKKQDDTQQSSGVRDKQVYTSDEYMEIGLAYFLELEDYRKSRDSFRKAAGVNILAERYVRLSEFMLGNQDMEDGMQKLLEEIEELLPEEQSFLYYYSLIRGYSLLNTEQSGKELIRIGELCFQDQRWKEKDPGHDAEIELRNSIAAAYDMQGDRIKALEQYEMLIKLEQSETELERIYQKLMELYEKEGKREQIETCYLEGLRKIPESQVLRLTYIGIQCRDKGQDRTKCMEKINFCIEEMPLLLKNREFQKLQKEYQIQMKGDKNE